MLLHCDLARMETRLLSTELSTTLYQEMWKPEDTLFKYRCSWDSCTVHVTDCGGAIPRQVLLQFTLRIQMRKNGRDAYHSDALLHGVRTGWNGTGTEIVGIGCT